MQYPVGATWSEADMFAVGEVDGTFACRAPSEAWNYAFPDPSGGVLPEKFDATHFAEFFGTDCKVEIPESKRGGRQVTDIVPIRILSARRFAETFQLPMPPEPPPHEIELPFDDAD
jgi:hypothetical protein